MSKVVAEIAIGVAIVAGTLLAGPVFGVVIGQTLLAALISAGASLTLSGVGTLLSKGPLQGQSGNIRNPISPWISIYGRAKTGGTIVFLVETGESDKYLHLVLVLACHPCEAVDSLMFDNLRVTLDTDGNSLSYEDSTDVIAENQTVDIVSISRLNDLVTVVLDTPFPAVASTAAGSSLVDGDQISIHGVAGDETLNGIFAVQVIDSVTFTYVNGGIDATVISSGQATTTFPDYGDTVHMEVALGTQSPESPPFPGLLESGDTGSQGLWTSAHLLQGRTAVYLRLKYGGNTYESGMPSISFLVRGKNDIYDPRTSPATSAYSENSALCIADYLANSTWGFKASYGTEIPLTPLISAANICDESVDLANGNTEIRYLCNGQFPLTTKRGEVLQNLLTSCGGRLTYIGGQFVIHPAAWIGPSIIVGATGGKVISSATLYALTSHIPSDTGAANATIFVSDATHPMAWGFSDALDFGYRIQDASEWTLRTDTLATFSGISATDLFNTVVSFRQHGGIGSTTRDQFLIYDCYATVTYTDSTTAIYRPDQSGTASNGFTHSGTTIEHPANAYDTSSDTFATINLPGWGIFAQYSVELQFTGFLPPSFSGTADPTATADSAASLQNMAGPFLWRPTVAVRDLFNGVKGTYISPANGWQSSDFPAYAQNEKHGYLSGSPMYPEGDANLAADGGDRRWHDVQLPFTISATMAQRLAKIELLRRRWPGTGTFVYNLAMYKATTLDVISFTLPLLGWYGKLLEISAHRFTVSKANDVTVLGTELDVKETDPSIYEWSTAEELTPAGFQQSNSVTTAAQTVSSPTGVSASNTTVAGTGGITTGQVQVVWTAPTDVFVSDGGSVIVQYSTDDTNWIALGTYSASTNTAYIPNVAAGETYWIRIAFVSIMGIQSGWTVYGPMTATGSSVSTSVNFVRETPTGTINGVNLTFSLSFTPNPTSSLVIYLNGVEQDQTRWCSVTSSAITFVIAPKTGDKIIAEYTH